MTQELLGRVHRELLDVLNSINQDKIHHDGDDFHELLNDVEKALAQPEQEPVAWATKEDFHRELERRLKHIREEMKIKSVTMRCKDYDIALPIIDTDFGRVLVGQVSTPPQRTEQSGWRKVQIDDAEEEAWKEMEKKNEST